MASSQRCSCTHSVQDKSCYDQLQRQGIISIHAYKASELLAATKPQQLGHSMKIWVIG